MAGEILVTLCGNLTKDPELRITPTGVSVVNFTIASTPRIFRDGEWSDGDATFINCQAWRTLADNIAETLTRGSRVIVTGKFQQRSYKTKDGENRSVYELIVDDLGPSIKFHPAKISKADRSSGKPADNPWDNAVPASAASADTSYYNPQTAASGGGSGFSDEPPF